MDVGCIIQLHMQLLAPLTPVESPLDRQWLWVPPLAPALPDMSLRRRRRAGQWEERGDGWVLAISSSSRCSRWLRWARCWRI